MIQPLYNTIKILRQNQKLKDTALFTILLLTAFISVRALLIYERIDKSLLNILNFSGLFTAILIGYFLNGLIQERRERVERKKEIRSLCNWLTNFRRLARVIYHAHDFWPNNLKAIIDSEYKFLRKIHLDIAYTPGVSNDSIDKMVTKFDNDKRLPGRHLYLDLKSLVNMQGQIFNLELYGDQDLDKVYRHDIIEEWYSTNAGSMLWYCLDHKWGAYNQTFNLNGLSMMEQKELMQLAERMDSKYKGQQFGRHVLTDLSNQLSTNYLEKLFNYSALNHSEPNWAIIFVFRVLVATLIFGVIMPFTLISLNIPIFLYVILTQICFAVMLSVVVFFLAKLKKLMLRTISV